MEPRRALLTMASLGVAGLLLAGGDRADGYGTIGFALPVDTQRGFRVFDEFADAAANDNTAADSSFPGYSGAVLAIWKGCVEWGSELHGSGDGDPHQPGGLGSGGADFDAVFLGRASAPGGIDDNVHAAVSGCAGSTLAYTVAPDEGGWSIRYCEEVEWDDGPGIPLGSAYDLQGIAAHEYGHALGLTHSTIPTATMFASANGSGVPARSIHADDIAGLQAIYGPKSPAKPRITGVLNGASAVEITGASFHPSDNEVWFTPADTNRADAPVRVLGVASTDGGTRIVVSVPTGAGPGDVLVKIAGKSSHDALSNAWPVALGSGPHPPRQAQPAGPPHISSVTPSHLQAVGLAPVPLTIGGSGFSGATAVAIDGAPLSATPPEYTVIDDSTIVVAAFPLVSGLGPIEVAVANAHGSDSAEVWVAANDPPVTDLRNGLPGFLFNSTGAEVVLAGRPRDLFFLVASNEPGASSLSNLASFSIGNDFASLVLVGTYRVDPVKGYLELAIPFGAPLPPGTTVYVQSAVVRGSAVLVTNADQGWVLF